MPAISPHSDYKTRGLVISVGLTIGLSIMGDSLMYALLPLEAVNLGIALPLVGLLLSANRLVRLVSNSWASLLFEKFGPFIPFVGATVLGFITTLLYGGGWGFLVFLTARMGWGVAWSGLRQGGYEAVAIAPGENRGGLMGVLWGIVRLGSAISVLLGGYLRDLYGYQPSVGIISGFTLLAVPVALSIRWPLPATATSTASKERISLGTKWKTALKTNERRAILSAGFLESLLEGILVSTAALLITEQLGETGPLNAFGIGIGAIAGLLLAVRFSASLIFGPLIGFISDRLGQALTALILSVSALFGLAGIALLSGAGPILCLILVFICMSGLFISQSAASSAVATRSEIPHLFVGAYTTLHDMGSAMGPLLAFSVGQVLGFSNLYLVCGLALLVVVIWFWKTNSPKMIKI